MKKWLVMLVVLLSASAARAEFEGILDFKMTADQGSGAAKVFLSGVGTRTEIEMTSPAFQGGGMDGKVKMIALQKWAEPQKMILLNEPSKSYSVVDVKEAGGGQPVPKFKVEKLGPLTIAGYTCQNARVTPADGGSAMEICSTNQIEGTAGWLKTMAQSDPRQANLIGALGDAGIRGFPIRFVAMKQDGSGPMMAMELVTAKRTALPASTFEVPAGYKESSFLIPFANADVQRKMEEAMKNMTPEQRKQMEQMMKGHPSKK